MSSKEDEMIKARIISASELADLSNEWNNPTVDVSKYYQNVIKACEVDKKTYKNYNKRGFICQEHNGKYFIAI
jgi:hypothetical protein